jgi:hypothetical protein
MFINCFPIVIPADRQVEYKHPYVCRPRYTLFHMNKHLQCAVIGLFLLISGQSFAQENLIPKDSSGFRDFLILQNEIPGMSYRFYIKDKMSSDTLLTDSLYSFYKTDSGYYSRRFTDFGQISQWEKSLQDDRLDYNLQYLVFSEVYSVDAAREYLLNRVQSGDVLVKFEEVKPTDDLVSLASNAPYLPLQRFKFRFISDYKLFIVTGVIAFFLVVASSMIVAMLLMKAKLNKREKLHKEYDRLIVDPLTSLLFEKEKDEILSMKDEEVYDYFPKVMLTKPLYKDVLIERIIGLNKKMKGDFKEKLKAIYKKLNLDIISIKSLESNEWDRVAMGLVQINEMDLVEALPEVKVHANSSNFHIRSQAVATLLNLSEKVDLTFLRDQNFPLSLWQQMNYLRIIRFVRHQKDLKLQILFDSKNQSIRIFGYKLVGVLGRVDLIEHLAARAGEVSDEEKIQILEVYSTLGAHMEVAFINDCLKSENKELAMAAAKAAGSIGDSVSADILAELSAGESNFRRKHYFLKSLYNLDKERFELATSMNHETETAEIRNHILDPMLQHV